MAYHIFILSELKAAATIAL